MQTERHTLKIAVYMMLIKDNKILLGRRAKGLWQGGNYGMPAGHMEKNETLAQGAIRECTEETGVSVKEEDVKFVHMMHRMNIYMDVFFVASVFSGEPRITEPDKCDDVKWFPLTALPENIVPSVRYAIEQYKNHIILSEFDPKDDE